MIFIQLWKKPLKYSDMEAIYTSIPIIYDVTNEKFVSKILIAGVAATLIYFTISRISEYRKNRNLRIES